MPHIRGSTTLCTSAVAMAASMALPPAARMSLPVSVASGCGVTTMPLFVIGPSALDHWRSAAIDVDGRARDEGALLGGEQAGEVGELLGGADAPERRALGKALGELVEIR